MESCSRFFRSLSLRYCKDVPLQYRTPWKYHTNQNYRLLTTSLSIRYKSSSSEHEQIQNSTYASTSPSIPLPSKLVSIENQQAILDRIPLEDVRSFCFIAHVDHGKSSLSSRLLEIAGNLGRESQTFAIATARKQLLQEGKEIFDSTNWTEDIFASKSETRVSESFTSTSSNKVASQDKEQIGLLDTLQVEQERGITVKATTASMLYPHPSATGPDGVLLLNMIDTPGHADFGREVVRSLSFVQGAVLLLDATQGIQAQTWTVHEKARSMANPPELILAMTKIDLDAARPIHVALSVSEWLSVDDPDTIIPTSARSRVGIAELLDAICGRVPPPKPLDNDDGDILRAQVVDSWYDSRGVNCIVQILSGSLTEGDRISIAQSQNNDGVQTTNSKADQAFSVQEVGLVLPRSLRTGKLLRGQMGYVRFGLRDPRQADPGTMLIFHKDAGKQIPMPSLRHGAENSKSVLYASVHPEEEDGFEALSEAVERLALNDKGLEVSRTADVGSSGADSGGPFLGPGLRVGFQGLLHVEVFRQRLVDEFGIEAVVTPPKVPYHITYLPAKQNNLQSPYTEVIEDLQKWPDFGQKFTVQEPIVKTRIMAPTEYTGAVMELITNKRGFDLTTNPLDEETWIFEANMPWAEVVIDFHDQLKNVTAGYGSLDTFETDPPLKEAKLSKVVITLNGDTVEPLSFVCYTPKAQAEARVVCKKLQQVLPRQQFVVVIQAKADGRIIASERIRAYRKDVLVKSGKMVGGGDISRKKKLLEAQKRGKKRQQQGGKVTLSQAAFNSVITRSG